MIGAGGLMATLALWRADGAAAPYAWLAAFATWIGAPLGGLGLILIHGLTGGKWGYAIRPQLTACASAFPLLPLFLAPLAFAARELYPWLRPGARPLQNAFYLNETGALARGAFYLVVWFALAWIVARRVRGADTDARLAAIAPAGLILLALTATFMSIDLIMSLDPGFSSSVFGLIRIADMGLLALSVCILSRLILPALDREALRQLGRLLLAIVILWAYLAFVELLIVWQSNLPNEASWYAPRLSGGWGVLAAAVAVMRFSLPFLFLLSARVQCSARAMRLIALLLVIGACANNLWLVGPQTNANSVMLAASYIAALVGMSATTLAVTSRGDRT
jgi:hypothetical protein